MSGLVDNLVELVGLIELIGGLSEGVYRSLVAPIRFSYTKPTH